MQRRTLLLVAVLTAFSAAPALAHDLPSLEGLNLVPGGGTTRLIQSDRRNPTIDDFDLVVSASDRLVNRLVSLNLQKAKPSPTGKRLKALNLSFREQGMARIEGRFYMPATDRTKAGEFDFVLSCALSTETSSDVVLDIADAQIKLNGVEVFRSFRQDPKPIGAVLDFLSPGIESAAAQGLDKMATSVSRSMGHQPADIDVNDLINIDGNRVVIRVLPHVLSPLLPGVQVRHIGIDRGMAQIFLSFSMGGRS